MDTPLEPPINAMHYTILIGSNVLDTLYGIIQEAKILEPHLALMHFSTNKYARIINQLIEILNPKLFSS